MEVIPSLRVDRDATRVGKVESFGPMVGVSDHQVDIELQIASLGEGPNQGRADCQVRNKVSIHHIQVKDLTSPLGKSFAPVHPGG